MDHVKRFLTHQSEETPKVIRFPVAPKLKTDYERLWNLVYEKFTDKKDKGGHSYLQHLKDVEANVISMFSVISVGYDWFDEALEAVIAEGYEERVAIEILGYTLKMVSIGHDLLEDTDVTAEDLRNMGIPERVVYNIELLTKKEGLKYGTPEIVEYLDKIKAEPVARAVKIADLLNNLDLQRLTFVGIKPKNFHSNRLYLNALEYLMS